MRCEMLRTVLTVWRAELSTVRTVGRLVEAEWCRSTSAEIVAVSVAVGHRQCNLLIHDVAIAAASPKVGHSGRDSRLGESLQAGEVHIHLWSLDFA